MNSNSYLLYEWNQYIQNVSQYNGNLFDYCCLQYFSLAMRHIGDCPSDVNTSQMQPQFKVPPPPSVPLSKHFNFLSSLWAFPVQRGHEKWIFSMSDDTLLQIDWKNGTKISQKLHRCIWLFYCSNSLWDTFVNRVTLQLSHKSWEANIRNWLFPVASLSSVSSEGVASLVEDVHLPSETVPQPSPSLSYPIRGNHSVSDCLSEACPQPLSSLSNPSSCLCHALPCLRWLWHTSQQTRTWAHYIPSFCLFTLISAQYVCFPKSGFVQCILCAWPFSL